MADAEEEWEYEYDENEAEDFYITLDLSNIPPKGTVVGSVDSQLPVPRISKTSSLQNRLRAFKRRDSGENATDSPISSEPASLGAMQINGLHTSIPLIVYEDQLLSCKWTSTIGTDMYFVKPDPDLGQPLRKLHSADLLGISSTKLMAVEARLRPRDEVVQQVTLPDMATSNPLDTSGAVEAHTTRGPPTSFLQKLNEAKAKRGDKTRLAFARSSGEARLIANEAQTQSGREANGHTGATGDGMQIVEDENDSVSQHDESSPRLPDGDTDIVMGEALGQT